MTAVQPALGPALEGDLLLPSGRTLRWAEYGDPLGRPVLTLHGAPGSRLTSHGADARLAASGIRQITYDRPGYGGSDPQPGRTIADAVGDITALLDHLRLDQVGIIGVSGGAPHALAMAALAPHRCTLVHAVVGPAPYDPAEFDFFEGMDPQNVRRFRAAMGGRQSAATKLGPELSAAYDLARTDPVQMFASMRLPESDRLLLNELAPSVGASLAEALRPGPWGFVDDFIAVIAPWGFDPAQVTARVLLEYGLQDVNVPASHGRWLATHVPNIEVRINPAAGHLASPQASLARLIEVANHRR